MALSKILLIALGLLSYKALAGTAVVTYYGTDEDGVVVGDHDNILVKYKSIAKPTNMPDLRSGDTVYIPIFAGKVLPGTSSPHNGCFRMDDTCPSALCRRNVNHFDIFIGNTRKYLAGMERILDSLKSTSFTKGCKLNAAVAADVQIEYIDDDYNFDNFEILDDDRYDDIIDEDLYDDNDLIDDGLFDDDRFDLDFDNRGDYDDLLDDDRYDMDFDNEFLDDDLLDDDLFEMDFENEFLDDDLIDDDLFEMEFDNRDYFDDEIFEDDADNLAHPIYRHHG